MRTLLLGWGSRGDVEPLVALGLRLRAAGHDVRVAAGRDFTAWIEGFGLRAEPFDMDVRAGSRSAAGRAWLGNSSSGLRREAAAMRRLLDAVAPGMAADLRRLVHPGDLVVSGALTFDPMLALARERRCRHVLACFAPSVPTRSGAACLWPVRPRASSVLNLAAGYAAAAAAYRIMRPAGDLVRAQLGQHRAGYGEYLRDARATGVLLAASPLVVPPPPDWGTRVAVTGYWALPTDETRRPDEELEAFLAAGEPPVYVGFGSMTSWDPAATFGILFGAVRRTGTRALLHPGPEDLAPGDLPTDLRGRVHVVRDAPHARLFPRTAAVVHHGGAGTTAAALRAGVPSLVVAHIADQPYWGRRVDELGVGPAPIRRVDLDERRLAAAVRVLVHDAGMRRRAAALGARLAGEDGVGAAAARLGSA